MVVGRLGEQIGAVSAGEQFGELGVHVGLLGVADTMRTA
jgi:hypothetical protein